jgi:origin recognition complex subunit 1
VSRHITASRRKAAAASGETGVMGLGALSVRRVERLAPATKLGRARVALSLATTPGSLPCRETERGKILDFVEQAIDEGNDCRGRSLYVSGVPGTGKTATVREVIRALRKKSREGYLPRFNHVELNGLRLQTPAHAYSAIAEELLGERLSPQRACEVLDARFKEGKGSDGRVTVLVVDEMDLLVTRTQQLLYNLFDWPTHRASRLVILGIANTLDLPERLLPKISSRLGNNKVVFKPYTAEQLKKIVKARLEDAALPSDAPKANAVANPTASVLETQIDAFDAVAIELASRKVAAVSGDARRVLELCRRAAELAETQAARAYEKTLAESMETRESADGSGAPGRETSPGSLDASEDHAQRRKIAHLNATKVVMRHIKDAMFEMFQSPHMRMLEAASRHDRIFLCALLLELKRSGVTEASAVSVARTHEQLCRAHGEQLPPAGATASIACRLAASGLLLADPGRRRAAQRVCLNVPLEDVVYALKDERRVQERKVRALTALRQSASDGEAAAARVAQNDADRGDIPWIRKIDL